jgi:integrase
VTVKSDVLCTVRKTMPIRRPNSAYRVREHLTEVEVTLLLKALKRNRHGKRDYAIGLIMFRHGLRVSECCDLRSDDIDLKASTIIVRGLKGSRDSTHYLERDEIQALRAIRGDNSARYVFTSERGDKVFTQIGMSKLLKRAGDAAGLEHPCPYDPALTRVRLGKSRRRHAPPTAPFGAREYHEHRKIQRHVAGAI